MLITLVLAAFAIGFAVASLNSWYPRRSKTTSRRSLPFHEVLSSLARTSGPEVCGLSQKSSDYDAHSLLYTKNQVESSFESSSWQMLAYDEFRIRILSKETGMKTFPCVYATMGYTSDDHRYLFLKSDNPGEPQNVRLIGPAIEEYLSMARNLGPNTSLVIFGAPSSSSKSVNTYNQYFWDMLRGLRIADPSSWPSSVPPSTEHEKWTFCYNGEPVFPVMLTPAHSRRYSRQMPTPVIALQPKWVLDELLSTPEKRAVAIGKVRKLLREYDSIDISPDLTNYGDAGTSESRQLCLKDKNQTEVCPFNDLDR